MICDQKLAEIRQDIAQAELSGVSDQEYIALLTKHTSNLVELVQQITSDAEQLRNLESLLSLLFGNLPEPVCVVNKEHSILFANENWWKLFPGKKNASNLEPLFSREDFTHLSAKVNQSDTSQQRAIFSFRRNKKQQLVIVIPLSTFHSDTQFILFVLSDEMAKSILTEEQGPDREKTAIEFSDSQKLGCRTAMQTAGIFEINFNEKLKIQSVSNEVAAILGYPPEKLIGKGILTIMPVDYRESLQKLLKKVNSEENELRYEVELATHSAGLKYFELTFNRFPDLSGWHCVALDISRFKAREEQLIQEKNEAVQSDKQKSDFLANMSHEIRTPLNGIVGFATMLSRVDLPDAKREKYLRIIGSSTRQLLLLVNDIIDHSKIEAGRLKIIYHSVNVHTMLDDLQTTFVGEAQRLEKSNVRLIKQTGKPGKKLEIKSDEIRLRQVLSNLLGNALKFTDDGEIRFGYSLDTPGSIRFFVKDSGIGLTKYAQRTIFNRYKQTQEGKKEKHNGKGLGLAISKGIVELMDGKIGVKSAPDEGSEFYFVLPLTLCEE